MEEKIKGSIVKVHFYNKDNGYAVGLFELDFKNKINQPHKSKVIGNRITVVGYFDRQPIEEEEYLLDGNYVKDKNYGLQFRFQKFERISLDSTNSIIGYLSSDLFPGIGVKIAKTVVETLGHDCIEKIRHDAGVLELVNINPKHRSVIYSGIINDWSNQKTVLFFLENGITIDTANKIINKLGTDIVDQIKTNPYLLMDRIDHFGFKKNDQFALRLGFKENSPERLRALLCYILKELIYNSGNSYVDKTVLYERIRAYIGEEIAGNDFNNILEILQNDKKIYIDERNNIFDYSLYLEELTLAEEIVKLLKGERNPHQHLASFNEMTIDKIYHEVEQESSREFSAQQQVAIRAAFTEPLVIITGGPGTGKTTIVHAIIKMYLKLHNNSSALNDMIALLAPTGRAAKRLKETTNMNAMTIHRFLGYQGGNNYMYSRYNKTNARLVIVDEASMMDLSLAYRLITSMHEDARLLIVGDVNQLPSVGPGQVLKDLIDTKEIKTVVLDKIHRQAEGSSIIKLAHSINEGTLPENILDKLNDRNFISTDNDHLAHMIIDLVDKSIQRGKDINKEMQILIPMYRGDCGITEINKRIQELVNPASDQGEFRHLNNIYRISDKVIQLVNHAEKNIMNGDIGFVQNYLYKDHKIIGITVLFDSGFIDYGKEEIEELSLAYAVSVHKAQGSEFDIVIMPISTKYYVMLKRKLIYTAITRAKKTLILIGDVAALNIGIKQIEAKRKTILKDKIIDYLKNGLHSPITEDISLNIDDEESAFDTLGEREIGQLKPSDFLD